ncbi:MAG: regulator [Gammaproteobacteria bacterium]|nr:regulator [Gammaproteobacteria bacterium]
MICWRLAHVVAAVMLWLGVGVCWAAPEYRVVESFEVGNNVYVRALSVDAKRNQLWIGTSVGAVQVNLKNGVALQTYTRETGLANEYVFAALADKQGDVWLGTNGGGVSRLTPKGWRTYFPMHGLADYWVYSFAEQTNGQIWIGTWAGLNQFDRQTGKFKTYVKELVNEWVYGLAVDAKQRLWVGTEGGVNMFDGKRWSVWTHAQGLGAPNEEQLPFSNNTGLGTRDRHDLSVHNDGRATYNPNYVFAILVAKDQQVWAGTWGGGVSRFDGTRWHNLTTKQGLAGNIVYSIAQDASGNMWFGTNQGLSRYDGRTWQTFNRRNGLLDNNVYALAVAPDGAVWAGTRQGVAKLTITK